MTPDQVKPKLVAILPESLPISVDESRRAGLGFFLWFRDALHEI